MNSNFTKIEQNLNCKFPVEFKDYISAIGSEEIILRLFDEDYRILYSITKKEEIKNWEEDVVKCSANHDESYYPEDKEFKKLPFARVLSGDGYKYLYFLCKEGEESNGEIYIRDTDSPQTGRIRISKNIQLIKGVLSEIENKIVINCRNKSFSEVVSFLTISNNINVWKDSFGIMSRDNKERKEEKVTIGEIDATIYEFEDKSENFAKFEIHITISTEEKLSFSSKAYEIDISGLRYQIENNVNYRIFYHKFLCALDCLKKTVSSLIESENITMDKFNELFNMDEFVSQVKKEFIQIDYGSY